VSEKESTKKWLPNFQDFPQKLKIPCSPVEADRESITALWLSLENRLSQMELAVRGLSRWPVGSLARREERSEIEEMLFVSRVTPALRRLILGKVLLNFSLTLISAVG
jgi:hypothetical protein